MVQLSTVPLASVSRPTGSPSFWQRRVVAPLGTFLTQGASPTALARAIAVGVVCGLFPFLGATTLLAFGVGATLRLNQPVIQLINQVLGPVQLLLIPVFVSGGAWLWGADEVHFSVTAMMTAAQGESWSVFLVQFGRFGLYALVAWAAVVPVLFPAVFLAVRPFLRRLARGLEGRQTP